jgi:uncharacterized glyoxalase superfamily protein PhnB
MPDQMTQQAVSPYLYYDDGVAAMDYLVNVFGFEERARAVREDGSLNHGEVVHRGAVIMLGTPPDGAGHAQVDPDARRDCSLMVYVEDVDAHFEHARDAGAHVVDEPMDQGYGRVWCGADPEGFRWYFTEAQ